MTFEMFAAWVIVAVLTGGLVSVAMKRGGYGRIWDLLLGLAGGGAATTIATMVGVPREVGSTGVTTFMGVVLLIVLQRVLLPVASDRREAP